MNTINFKGEIVDSRYDLDFFDDYFAKGIITCASRVVPALDALAEGEEASVFVDSPGGEVFEGDRIIIAALKALERGAKLTVEIGSEACSMAANFMAAMKANGAKVIVHSNSKIMFHSASVGVIGGAGLLEDRAALIRGINENVIANLKKCGVKDCEGWFEESRETHLTGSMVVTMGLADSCVEAVADKVDIKAALANFRVAALKVMSEGEGEAAPVEEAAPEAPAETAAPAEIEEAATEAPVEPPAAPEAPVEAPAAGDWEARYKGASKKINELQAKLAEAAMETVDYGDLKAKLAERDAAIVDFKSKLEISAKDLASAKAEVSDLTAKLESATKDLAATRERAEIAEKARALLTGGGLFTPNDDGSDYKSRMAKARTAEEREALRAEKRAGKIK